MSSNLWKSIHEKQYSVRYNERQFSIRFMKKYGVPAAIEAAAKELKCLQTGFIKRAINEKLASLGYDLSPMDAETLLLLCREVGYEPDESMLARSRFYRKGAQHVVYMNRVVSDPAVIDRASARQYVFTDGNAAPTTFIKICIEDKLAAMGIDPAAYAEKKD